MYKKNPKLNYTQVEALKMLILKNKTINDFIVIKWIQRAIEDNKTEKNKEFIHSDDIIKSREKQIDNVLDWRTLEELYKWTAYEYAEITSLLFD